MSRDKQTEIHELAKQMSEAISTAIEQRYIEDEAKLQAVLKENGWRKSTDLAREIFEEIEKCTITKVVHDGEVLCDFSERFAELKKKYTGEDTNVLTKESEKDND